MFAGGADAPLVAGVVAGYRNARRARYDAPRRRAARARPFDSRARRLRDRRGRGHARARGARARAARAARASTRSSAGYGSSCDAAHLTDPDETGAGPGRRDVAQALVDAGIAPEDIGYVNAHATSTSRATSPRRARSSAPASAHAAVSSTKSMHGHTLGGGRRRGGGRGAAAARARPAAADAQPRSRPDDGSELDHVADGTRSIETDATRSRTASASAATTPRSCCAGTSKP